MGTKVQCYMPGYYYSMRDLNEDSSSNSWPVSYGDNKAMANGQYHNGFVQNVSTDGYLGYGKDALKQKMLEHEAVFRSQVCELHRLYRIQREMMEELKRKEQHKLRVSTEQSSSSSRRGSQDPRKWHMAGFPLFNEIENSPMSCTKGYSITQPSSHSPFHSIPSLKEPERPLKLRKKLFDLQLPADEYIDTEEEEGKVSDMLSHSPYTKGGRREIKNLSLGDRGIKLADLNEPFEVEESLGPSTVDFLDRNGKKKGESRLDKSDAGYFGENEENRRICDGFSVKSCVASSSKSNLSFATPGPQKEKMPILSHPATGMPNRAPGSGPFFSSCFSSSQPHSSDLQLLNPSSNSNLISGCNITAKNGFYHGSSSKANHFPGFDHLNCSSRAASNRSTNRIFGQILQNPSRLENSKPVIYIDLNEDEDGSKSKQTLPWLTDLNQPSNDFEVSNTEKIESAKKLMGFPIFETDEPQNAPPVIDCTKNVDTENKNRAIDLNLECELDEDSPVDIRTAEKGKMGMRGPLIDLNFCDSNFIEEHDVETALENTDDIRLSRTENETSNDELLRNAADIMVAISSYNPLAESLMWLAGLLEAHGPDVPGPGPPHGEIDDFEAMTLQIEESKEEDYMPAPFAPILSEKVGPTVYMAGRPRRGQQRRGRQQRRDFQRDILPGLASLSRQEVTEDIQMLGGLMRATGHHWSPGQTKRNGGPRGRRRTHAAEEQLVDRVEGRLEDRSITGWGKKTRRPRRQRCQLAGNSSNSNCSNNPPAVRLLH
ncbi:Plant protein of unknown function (DUF863 [Striga hermonthica]|uniref:Uncharacterized protein n=1 Tax=Striga hermonthica TaxID=68872 RepID=A0A9N7N6G8_STRHE|nr:Plant protein of unknown function (DUF863 [Striga hermonthica]